MKSECIDYLIWLESFNLDIFLRYFVCLQYKSIFLHVAISQQMNNRVNYSPLHTNSSLYIELEFKNVGFFFFFWSLGIVTIDLELL